MSLEAVLTVITVILAVFAIIPAERSHDLRIRLGGSAAFAIGIAAALILYWSLLEPLHALPGSGWLPRLVPWLSGWGPASSSMALFLLATGYCSWIYGRPIPASRLPRLAQVFSDALARRRFSECTHLLEAHLGIIHQVLERNYWQARLRKQLRPTIGELHLRALEAPAPAVTSGVSQSSGNDTRVDEVLSDLSTATQRKDDPKLIRRLRAVAERPSHAAHDLVRSVGLSPQLARHIAATNPYLGLRVSLLPSSWLARDFAEVFAEALVSDPESILYRELRRAENVDADNVPLVDPLEQPLLAALCDDALRRDGPTILYTFLNAGIQALGSRAGSDVRQELNSPIGDYHERARWFSPPFSTIYLLAITAPRVAVSPEAQRLDLSVMSSLATALIAQMSPSGDDDPLREWPTPTHYLLYECVSLLAELVAIWRDRPEDLPANRLAQQHDGLPYILPAYAVDVLAGVMKIVLESSKLNPRFKGHLLEVWWSAYWPKYGPAWDHGDTVLRTLVKGGRWGSEQPDATFREGVRDALAHIDVMRQYSEGGDDVRAAFELPPRSRGP